MFHSTGRFHRDGWVLGSLHRFGSALRWGEIGYFTVRSCTPIHGPNYYGLC
jgi:hypothetical protein